MPGNVRVEKLSRKQSLAVVTLLTQSLKDAAEAVGVSEKTLWRWMQLDHFAAAVRSAQHKALTDAIGQLQAVSLQAVQTLVANLASEVGSVSNRAAIAILDQAIKGRELLDFAERLASLENTLKSLEEVKHARPTLVGAYRVPRSRSTR